MSSPEPTHVAVHRTKEHTLTEDCWCEPALVKADEVDDFLLGEACSIEDEPCESCQ